MITIRKNLDAQQKHLKEMNIFYHGHVLLIPGEPLKPDMGTADTQPSTAIIHSMPDTLFKNVKESVIKVPFWKASIPKGPQSKCVTTRVITAKVTATKTKQKQRIMVIYNSLDSHEVLNEGLALDGYDVIVAKDEDHAIKMLDTVTPDMVIMDTVTADKHSLNILDSVKNKSDVPFIIITADVAMDTLKNMFDHGADDIVYRPLNMRSFIARVHAIMRRWYRFRNDIVVSNNHYPNQLLIDTNLSLAV